MKSPNFVEVLKSLSFDAFPLLGPNFQKPNYVPLDLSDTNETLNEVDVSSSEQLHKFVQGQINKQNGLVGYGGYLEVRTIYGRSEHFNAQEETGRNIHIGLDLWCDANTNIHAPLEGSVHSFANNANYGDYGPTIILEHNISNLSFYTLYGHLSLLSIENLEIGQIFSQGDCIGTLGDSNVNGDYPPHLHFQIIKDIEGYKGDYPGVSSQKDLTFYLENCPDPQLLIKI